MFPKKVVPPNHPSKNRVFYHKSSILGYPIFGSTPMSWVTVGKKYVQFVPLQRFRLQDRFDQIHWSSFLAQDRLSEKVIETVGFLGLPVLPPVFFSMVHLADFLLL